MASSSKKSKTTTPPPTSAIALPNLEDLRSRREVAEALGMSEASIFRWQRAGLLTPYRIAGGRVTRYDLNEVRALLSKDGPSKGRAS
jgi:predicted DNA-binding transcriptional regulator AlpA